MKLDSVKLINSVVAIFALVLFSAGCADSGSDDDEEDGSVIGTGINQGTGALSFALTDAPVDGAKSVLITVSRLEVLNPKMDDSSLYLAGSDNGNDPWIVIPLEESAEIDLLELQNGLSTPLAALSGLGAGQYNQIRMFLDETAEPKVILEDDSEHALYIPSVDKSGIKITRPFIITDGEELELIVDFDVRKSLVAKADFDADATDATGMTDYNYILKPTLRLIEGMKCGTITGEAAVQAKVACAYEHDGTKDEDADCENAVNSAIVNEGEYILPYLPEGEYDVRVFNEDGTYVDVTDPVEVDAGVETPAE